MINKKILFYFILSSEINKKIPRSEFRKYRKVRNSNNREDDSSNQRVQKERTKVLDSRTRAIESKCERWRKS